MDGLAIFTIEIIDLSSCCIECMHSNPHVYVGLYPATHTRYQYQYRGSPQRIAHHRKSDNIVNIVASNAVVVNISIPYLADR